MMMMLCFEPQAVPPSYPHEKLPQTFAITSLARGQVHSLDQLDIRMVCYKHLVLQLKSRQRVHSLLISRHL